MINSCMQDSDYELDNHSYPYSCLLRGTLKDYLKARNWAVDSFSMQGWSSTWTSDSSDFMDDQLRDWRFVFKSRDNYLLFMLTWLHGL